MKKKVLGLLLGTIFTVTGALSMTACGGNGGGIDIDDDGNSIVTKEWWTTTGTLEKDANGKVEFNDVGVKLSTVVAGEDKGYFNQIVEEFNALYRGKITVIPTNIAENGFEDTIAKQISNNETPPDLIMSHQKGHKSFVDSQLIQPFDETMELSGITFDMKDYSDGLAKYSSLGFKDNLFSIPCDAQSSVVFYNKSIIGDKALPTTHSELLTLCDEIAAEKNITPIAWATGSAGYLNYLFPTAIMQNGGTLYNTSSFYAEWDNEQNMSAFKNAIKSFRDLTTRKPKALAPITQSNNEALNEFLYNRAAFYITNPWDTKSLISGYARINGITEVEAKENFVGATSTAGWFAIDENSSNAKKIYGDSHFFAMSKSVTDINVKAAICEFVKWFTGNGSAGAEWAEAGHVTASKVIAADTAYTENEFVKNYISKFYPDINNFECTGNTPFFLPLRTYTGSIIVTALANSTDASDESIIKTAMKSFNGEVDFLK